MTIQINDYEYSVEPRESLKNSYIHTIIKKDYLTRKDVYVERINNIARFKDYFYKIALHAEGQPAYEPCWHNGWLPAVDSMSLYATLAANNFRYYIECGSGNSTKFAARAIRDHGLRTKIISIDPMPRAEIDSLCEKIYRVPFENMDYSFFETITSEDILIIDNSHRAFCNSDVTVFFTEILPLLPRGLLYALHDICLPYDYSEVEARRYYNEQYLLASYIIGGMMGDAIYLPLIYLTLGTDILRMLDPLWAPGTPLESVEKHGCFFWMQKCPIIT